MKNFVIVRNMANAQHATALDALAIVTIQECARELMTRVFEGPQLVLVGVVKANDEISARLAQTEPNGILWLYWHDNTGTFRYPVGCHGRWHPAWANPNELLDPIDALMRWARVPSPSPPSRDQVMAMRPGSNERALAAKIWLLSLCVSASSRTGEDPIPEFLAAINALPDMRLTQRLAPEMRMPIEDAVGLRG